MVVVKYRDCLQLLENISLRRRTEEVIVDARRLDDLLIVVVDDIIIHADAIGNVAVVIVECTTEEIIRIAMKKRRLCNDIIFLRVIMM